MFGRIDADTPHPVVKRKLVSPSGDLGAKREAEGNKAISRGIKKDGTGNLPAFPMGKPRLMNNGGSGAGAWPKGPDTMGGVVGGKSDKADYQGVKKTKSG